MDRCCCLALDLLLAARCDAAILEYAGMATGSSKDAATGLCRPPFKAGLPRHTLLALLHDDPSWEFPYFLGLVRYGL